MGRTVTWGWVWTLLLLGACAQATSDEDVAGRSAAIAGGTPEPGAPAVVLVYNREAGGMCTGAIIAPRVVLTAKHCVQEPGAAEPSAARSMTVGIGSDIRNLSESLSVVAVTTTEGIYTEGRTGLDGALIGQDVAVLTLSQATEIEPLPIRRDRPEDVVGEEVTLVGFGETPSGGSGRKFTTTATVDRLRGPLLYIGPSICQGDSGGPMIQQNGEVIGVASFGTGVCGGGTNAFNAIADYSDMIDDVIRDSGACVPDGPELCDGIDNDCNDQVDEVCTPVGEPCAASDECESGLCDDTSAGRICTAECDPTRPTLGCPPSLYCGAGEGCEGRCLPGSAGDGRPLSTCDADTDCASLRCAETVDGGRCADPCRADDGMCLAGELCTAGPGGCGACLPVSEPTSVGRGLGEPCDADGACQSTLCLADGLARYCSRSCDDDAACGESFHCREDQCVRGRREGDGGHCVTNDDCSDETVCASQGQRTWCARMCDEDGDCTDGFDCVDAEGARLCAPSKALLGETCAEDNACISGLCASETGECARTCSVDSPCPTGFECHRGGSGDGLCRRPPITGDAGGGGCSVRATSDTDSGAVVLLALAGLAILGGRRRFRAKRMGYKS